MTRGGTRLIAALVAAALVAGLLAACGSSDSSSTTSTSSTSTSTTTASQGGSGSDVVSTPLRVSGGGSGQFRIRGGDNSIQEFGEESDESELEEAAEVLHSFFIARAEENWASACSYLADSITQQLEQLAAHSPQLGDKGCPVILKAFTRPVPADARRETTVVDAGSLRGEGEQAFLIFYGAGKAAYAMPMKQEEGGWRVGGLGATPLS